MTKTYYLTTPLYYVNAKPHIGHAYTTVAADALARFKRLMGYDVLFLTGTDEHGQKVERAALAANKTPQDFTDELSNEFRQLWAELNISYDDFIRTTEARHKKAVCETWKRLQANGQIEIQKYKGWYDATSETFMSYREMKEAKEAGGHQHIEENMEEIEEENFFFKLSAHQKWLMDYVDANPDFIQPKSRRNEAASFLEKNDLNDLCISRPKERLQWGIETPLSDKHVTYVWFDALVNYISACGFPDDEAKFKKYWPADVHLIGKDILRPHTVYWPIMLHGMGLEPPKKIFAHGWWMVDELKMSKSLGNVIRPKDVVDVYGVDPFRFFMLREVPFGQDGTYSDEAMTKRYNVDLANDLGNLTHRTLSMMEKYFDGVIIADGAKDANNLVRDKALGLAGRLEILLDQMQFSQALSEIWSLITEANRFIEHSAPWTLKKESKIDELRVVMVSCCEALRLIAQAVWPFIPHSAENLWEQLGLNKADLANTSFAEIEWNYFTKDTPVKKGQPIFPRLEL